MVFGSFFVRLLLPCYSFIPKILDRMSFQTSFKLSTITRVNMDPILISLFLSFQDGGRSRCYQQTTGPLWRADLYVYVAYLQICTSLIYSNKTWFTRLIYFEIIYKTITCTLLINVHPLVYWVYCPSCLQCFITHTSTNHARWPTFHPSQFSNSDIHLCLIMPSSTPIQPFYQTSFLSLLDQLTVNYNRIMHVLYYA